MLKRLYSIKPVKIPFTQEGFDALKTEQAALLKERPEAVEHLRKAREMGDLSENGYYRASRSRLTFLDGRLKRLEKLIKAAVITTSKHNGRIDIGSNVTISDGVKDYTYTIVGGYESNPANMTISFLSPIGKALIGRQEGDSVTVQAPKKTITYKVKSIT